jgi:hypothetical protein
VDDGAQEIQENSAHVVPTNNAAVFPKFAICVLVSMHIDIVDDDQEDEQDSGI